MESNNIAVKTETDNNCEAGTDNFNKLEITSAKTGFADEGNLLYDRDEKYNRNHITFR